MVTRGERRLTAGSQAPFSFSLCFFMRMTDPEDITALELLAVEIELASAVSIVSPPSPRSGPRDDHPAFVGTGHDGEGLLTSSDVVEDSASDDSSDSDTIEHLSDRRVTPPRGVFVLPRRPVTRHVAGVCDFIADRMSAVAEGETRRN